MIFCSYSTLKGAMRGVLRVGNILISSRQKIMMITVFKTVYSFSWRKNVTCVTGKDGLPIGKLV